MRKSKIMCWSIQDWKLRSNKIRTKLIVEELEDIVSDLSGDSKIKVQSFITPVYNF